MTACKRIQFFGNIRVPFDADILVACAVYGFSAAGLRGEYLDSFGKLNTLVTRSGLSREAYLRQIISGLQPRDLPSRDFRLMMRQLYYCGNNLNQIARQVNATGRLYDAEMEQMLQYQKESWQAMNQLLAKLASLK